MNSLAQRCGIAPGTLYNYYADKDALLLAAVESVWQSIFHEGGACVASESFLGHIESLFRLASQGARRYPNFLTTPPRWPETAGERAGASWSAASRA